MEGPGAIEKMTTLPHFGGLGCKCGNPLAVCASWDAVCGLFFGCLRPFARFWAEKRENVELSHFRGPGVTPPHEAKKNRFWTTES